MSKISVIFFGFFVLAAGYYLLKFIFRNEINECKHVWVKEMVKDAVDGKAQLVIYCKKCGKRDLL